MCWENDTELSSVRAGDAYSDHGALNPFVISSADAICEACAALCFV
jgi:hypothetical protein